MSPNCARRTCRSSISGNPTPTRTSITSLSLYKGIVIGVAGLLALFLTIVFVVKGAVIFPAAAALAWAVLAYVCIDFGFWDKIFGTEGQADRIWRAGAETSLAATLLVFLFAYLNLNRWHVRASHVAVGLAGLPRRARRTCGLSTRRSRPASRAFRSPPSPPSASFSCSISPTHGYDRAVMLIPTWFLLLVWVIARPASRSPARSPTISSRPP